MAPRQKITPYLWYDKEAKEAATFYSKCFPNTLIRSTTQIQPTPSGSTDIVDMQIEGMDFTLISAGPHFKFTPAISFLVALRSREKTEELWKKLSDGGMAMMEFGSYPFSDAYGWTADRYGLSWQVMHAPEGQARQTITPGFLFVGAQCGRAEEAIRHWVSVFRDSSVGDLLRYEAGEEPDRAGTIKHAAFTLERTGFSAMDSAHEHKFAFNEAVSLAVRCADQREIDYYWEKLSADPRSEQCGWVKDRFGVSWQILPAAMQEMLASKDRAAADRVTRAFLPMKKLDLAVLEAAYRGEG